MAVVAGNLVVGNATVTVTRPSNAGGSGSATDVGALKDGVTITPTFTVFNVDIEQELMPSRYWYTDKKFQVEFTICEPTVANLRIAWDVINASSGSNPVVTNFGTATSQEFVPTAHVIACTSFVPGGSGGNLYTRTVTFHKALLETPGPTVFSKRQETNLKCTFNCAFDTSTSRVGQFSDATA